MKSSGSVVLVQLHLVLFCILVKAIVSLAFHSPSNFTTLKSCNNYNTQSSRQEVPRLLIKLFVGGRGYFKNKESTKNNDKSCNTRKSTAVAATTPLKSILGTPLYSTSSLDTQNSKKGPTSALLMPLIASNDVKFGLSQLHPTALHEKTHQKKDANDASLRKQKHMMERRSQTFHQHCYLNTPIPTTDQILFEVNCSFEKHRHRIKTTAEPESFSSLALRFGAFEPAKSALTSSNSGDANASATSMGCKYKETQHLSLLSRVPDPPHHTSLFYTARQKSRNIHFQIPQSRECAKSYYPTISQNNQNHDRAAGTMTQTTTSSRRM